MLLIEYMSCLISDSKTFVGDIEFDEVRGMKNTLGPFKSIQSLTVDFFADIIIGVVSEDNEQVV